MADHIPAVGQIHRGIETPLTLTKLQILVGGFITFIELRSGESMAINERSPDKLAPYNKQASTLAGQAIYGDAVLFDIEELA